MSFATDVTIDMPCPDGKAWGRVSTNSFNNFLSDYHIAADGQLYIVNSYPAPGSQQDPDTIIGLAPLLNVAEGWIKEPPQAINLTGFMTLHADDNRRWTAFVSNGVVQGIREGGFGQWAPADGDVIKVVKTLRLAFSDTQPPSNDDIKSFLDSILERSL